MKYLTYSQYEEIGGALEEKDFNRNIDRANGIISVATHNRVTADVPVEVKALCRDLVEFLNANSGAQGNVSSRSQSAGSVSESVSYGSTEDFYVAIDNMLCDYLLSVKDSNGVPLLYRGCTR